MSTEIKRGLGDNSQKQDVKINYKTWGEILTDLVSKVSELGTNLQDIKAMHKASHGHEYTFENEVDEKRTCRPLGRVIYGNKRKCTPYEKKDFAGTASHELDRAYTDHLHIHTMASGLLNDIKELEDE